MKRVPYAEGSEVPVERSKAELEKLLQKYGARKFASGWDAAQIVILFDMDGRQIKIAMPIPTRDDPAIRTTPSGRYVRSDSEIAKAWQGAIRQRWRALVLIVKAKLEAVSAGVFTFEEEFLGQLVLPGAQGRTVAELVVPHLDELPRALALSAGEKSVDQEGA